MNSDLPICAHTENGHYCNHYAPNRWSTHPTHGFTISLCDEHFAAYPARPATDAEFQSLIDAEEREPDIITPALAEAITKLIGASKDALKAFSNLHAEEEPNGKVQLSGRYRPIINALRAALVAVGALEGEDPR